MLDINAIRESLRRVIFLPFALILVLFGSLCPEPGTMVTLIGLGLLSLAFGLMGEKMFLGLRLEIARHPHPRILLD